MGSSVKPHYSPEAMAKLLGNQPPAAGDDKPAAKQASKKPASKPTEPAKLPAGRMGERCRNKECKGKLTDLSRAHIGKSKTEKGKTLITLICDKCNQVQAQAEIPDLN